MMRRTFLTGLVPWSLAGVAAIAGVTPASPASAVGIPAAAAAPRRSDEPAIVYSLSQQRIWVLEPGFKLVKTHLVSGRYGNPKPGEYRVWSKSLAAGTKTKTVTWQYMVRFAGVPGNAIGFHQIPVRCKDGKCAPVQSVAQLGTAHSAGCVRQKASDARWLYNWAQIGTLVIVTR